MISLNINTDVDVDIAIEIKCKCGYSLEGTENTAGEIIVEPCPACLSASPGSGLKGHWFDVEQVQRGLVHH